MNGWNSTKYEGVEDVWKRVKVVRIIIITRKNISKNGNGVNAGSNAEWAEEIVETKLNELKKERKKKRTEGKKENGKGRWRKKERTKGQKERRHREKGR